MRNVHASARAVLLAPPVSETRVSTGFSDHPAGYTLDDERRPSSEPQNCTEHTI